MSSDEQAVAIAMANASFANAAKSRDVTKGATGRATRLTKGLTPETLATYLDDFYEGKFYSIAMLWDAMQDGDVICAPVAEKRLSKISAELRNYTVEALDETPAAQAQQKFVEQLLESGVRAEHAIRPAEHGGLRKAVEFLCDAVGKKYSFCAKIWEGNGDDMRLTLKHVPLWHFREQDDGSYKYYPNPKSTLSATSVNDSQWVVAVRRRAVMQAASLAICLRRLPVQQVARALEKFGVPNVFGTTTSEPNSPGWQAMSNALYSYMSDMPVLMSEGNKIEIAESNFRAASVHKTHLENCTTEIIINWLGGELGTVSKSGSGTLAGGAQANDLDDLIRDDCDWLTDVINEQIIRDAIARRFPKQPVLARFVLRKPDDVDDEADMDILERAVALGAQVPASYLHDRFGLPVATGSDAVLVSSQSSVVSGEQPMPNARRSSTIPAFHQSTIPRGNAALPSRVRDRRPDLDQLAENSIGPIAESYAGLLAPLLEQMFGEDMEGVQSAAESFVPSEEALDAFAETMAQVHFAAAMMGGEPLRSGIVDNGNGGIVGSPNALASPAERRQLANLLGTLGLPNADPTSAFSILHSAFSSTNPPIHQSSIPRAHADASVAYEPLPFDEARAFWAQKVLIPEFASDEAQAQIWADSRVRGFRVAGISGETALKQAQAVIARAIEGEATVDQVKRQLRDQFGLGTKHAETVARTNIQSAYSWGNWQQINAPSVTEAFPLLAFDVTLDEQTSGICAPLAEKAYPREHPIWATMYPPNHFNCRTTVFPTTAEEAGEDGFEVMVANAPMRTEMGTEILPDKSFTGNIGQGTLADMDITYETTWASDYVASKTADQ
jgi:SPP1 gp7 family putative phage head morphogenesis protein